MHGPFEGLAFRFGDGEQSEPVGQLQRPSTEDMQLTQTPFLAYSTLWTDACFETSLGQGRCCRQHSVLAAGAVYYGNNPHHFKTREHVCEVGHGVSMVQLRKLCR